MTTVSDSPTYGSYLRLPELLACQSPATDEHDELLFVIIHQVYELWFKQILHEAALLQARLEAGHGTGALHTARRIAKILKTIVGQLDVLETMTPRQFSSFRPQLGSSSGFQSDQFRELEAVLGRRDLPADDPGTAAALKRRSVFDSLLRYLHVTGFDVPEPARERDPAEPWRGGDPAILDVLALVYADDGGRRGRGLRGARRHRRGHPGVALPAREDGRADHRGPHRHRRLRRRGVPAQHAVPAGVPRPVGGAQCLSRSGRGRPPRRPTPPTRSPGCGPGSRCPTA